MHTRIVLLGFAVSLLSGAVARATLVIVRPVVLQAPSGLDVVPPGTLPTSADIVDINNVFVIELWAQQTVLGPQNGINCVFTDLAFDPANMTCGSIALPTTGLCVGSFCEGGFTPGAPCSTSGDCPGGFSDFSGNGGGICDNINGLVDETGGCTFDAGFGITPGWVRIATVFQTADVATSGNVIDSLPSTTGISLVPGLVDVADIIFESSPPFCIRTSLVDDSCNGIDDDCDGFIDDDYVIDNTCGVGYCQDTNIPSSCVAAVETLCQEGTQLSATDPTCDGVDDDCDGGDDDDYVIDDTCGVGNCLTTNTPSSCVAGLETSCQEGTPAADDTTCDDVDDDCNALIDDGYVPLPTNCGVGACVSTGVTSCVAGTEEDSCTPGAPALDDATCDGVDDDCNGTDDEDYVPVARTCGDGVCASIGVVLCDGGNLNDTCVPGSPTGPDDDCNGIDEDCNGVADDNYVPAEHETSCGVGACEANGVLQCLAGGTTNDTCVPGAPSAEVCDGIDNNCDGTADEEPAASDSCGGVEACVGGACEVAVFPPVAALPPHDRTKDRYLSFIPDNGTASVGHRVELISTDLFPSSSGVIGWVDAPNAEGLSRLTAGPVFRVWSNDVVHTTGCAVVPAGNYEVSSSQDGVNFSAPLVIATTPMPTSKFWGDLVGSFDGTTWSPPQGVANFDDTVAVIKAWQEAPGAPHVSVVDIEPQELNFQANFNDVFQTILAFQGLPYPFSDPMLCP